MGLVRRTVGRDRKKYIILILHISLISLKLSERKLNCKKNVGTAKCLELPGMRKTYTDVKNALLGLNFEPGSNVCKVYLSSLPAAQ